MKPTGAHHNKSGNPEGNSNPSSKEGKSARRPPPVATGGGAMASTEAKEGCSYGNRCTDMHCQISDEQHGVGFKRPKTCWRIKQGHNCSKCNTKKEPNQRCQFGANCRYMGTTCTKVHPEPVNVSETSPVQPVQAQLANESGTPLSYENFPSLEPEEKLVAPVVQTPIGFWTNKTVEPDVSLNLSGPISCILNCFDSGVFASLKLVLNEQLELCQNLEDLLIMGGIVLTSLDKVNPFITDINEYEQEKLEEKFNELLQTIMKELGCEESMPCFPEGNDVCENLSYFATAFDSLNEFLKNTQKTPLPESQSFSVPVPATKAESSSAPMFEKIRVAVTFISEMMKGLPLNKQGDLQRCLAFLNISDKSSCPPELVEQMLKFAKNAYDKIIDHIRIEEEARMHDIRESLLNPKHFEVNASMSESMLLAMSYMFAISFTVGSNMGIFDEIVSKNEELRSFVDNDQKGYFDQLVRAIYRKLIRSDSDASNFQNAVLTPCASEVPETIRNVFETATAWFILSQKSSEGSVYESLSIFSSWNDQSQLLTPAFLDFLYSYIKTRGDTQSIQISKTVDNHFIVIMKYFGIRMVASEKGFGKKFLLSYKLEGTTHEIDVSSLVCEYVFKLLCMSKVFVDNGKTNCVRLGNCGIGTSISQLFDLVGKDLIDSFGEYRPFKAATRDFKEQHEHIPSVYAPSLVSKVKSKSDLTKQDGVHERVMVLKYFFDKSIVQCINSSYDKKTEKKEFEMKLIEVEKTFLPTCQETEIMERFFLFLSTLKSDPMTKLMKMGVEILTDKSVKKDISIGFAFLDKQDVGEFQKLLLKIILQYSSNITDDAKLDECVGNAVSDFSEVLQFIASSGVTLIEVLHVCDMFKDLYNSNKSNKSGKMVFFNFFLAAFMVAASKKWNLTFQTMYTSMVTSLVDTTYVKPTDQFNKQVTAGIAMMRLTGFNFNNCLQEPHCQLFCKEASNRGSIDNPSNLANFQRLLKLVCPFVMISDLMFKQQPETLPEGMSMSLSNCLDRVAMLLLTSSNREQLFDLFGLMKPTLDSVPKENVKYRFSTESPNSRFNVSRKDSRIFEEQVVSSMLKSIKANTVSNYFSKWNRYCDQYGKDMKLALDAEDMKTLRKNFRMDSEMKTFFEFLITSGLATNAVCESLKNNPNLYTFTKRGNRVLNICEIATTIVAQNNGFSLEFYEDVLKMIHSALYPNFNDATLVRQMVREMVEFQKSQRRKDQGQAPVVEQETGSGMSMFAAMFGDDTEPEPETEAELTVEYFKNCFLEMLPKDISEKVDSRLGASPVVFTCGDVRGFFTNRQSSDADVETLPPSLSKYYTREFQDLISALNFLDVMKFFSDIQAYIDTFFSDDEEEGINLADFRADVLNTSSDLSKAFNRYVEAAINEATESIQIYQKHPMNQVD